MSLGDIKNIRKVDKNKAENKSDSIKTRNNKMKKLKIKVYTDQNCWKIPHSWSKEQSKMLRITDYVLAKMKIYIVLGCCDQHNSRL